MLHDAMQKVYLSAHAAKSQERQHGKTWLAALTVEQPHPDPSTCCRPINIPDSVVACLQSPGIRCSVSSAS